MVVYPRLRRFYSWGYQELTRLLFGLTSPTPRPGSSSPAARSSPSCCPILEEDGFIFDLELLAVAKRRGYTHVVELPVEIRERFSSTISPRAVFDMLVDTVRLTWRLRIARSYDRVGTGGGCDVGARKGRRAPDHPLGAPRLEARAPSRPRPARGSAEASLPRDRPG